MTEEAIQKIEIIYKMARSISTQITAAQAELKRIVSCKDIAHATFIGGLVYGELERNVNALDDLIIGQLNDFLIENPELEETET